jgi:hypothetical protein
MMARVVWTRLWRAGVGTTLTFIRLAMSHRWSQILHRDRRNSTLNRASCGSMALALHACKNRYTTTAHARATAHAHAPPHTHMRHRT